MNNRKKKIIKRKKTKKNKIIKMGDLDFFVKELRQMNDENRYEERSKKKHEKNLKMLKRMPIEKRNELLRSCIA